MKRRGSAAAACLLSLLLTCCAAQTPSGAMSAAPVTEEAPGLQQEAFDLPFEMISSPDLTSYGSGTSEGFYSAFLNEDGSRNILYVDYASALQVYLCAQPNCEHNSESCPAWIAPFGGTVTLAAGEKELFLVCNGFNGGARIERADLNGENRRELLSLPGGAMVENAVAFNGRFLVLSILESVGTGDSLVQADRLVAVDLNGGEQRILFSLEDYVPEEKVLASSLHFLGVTEDGFIVKTSVQLEYDSSGSDEQIIQNMGEALHTSVYQIPFDGTTPVELLFWRNETCKGVACGGGFFCVMQKADGSLELKQVENGSERVLCPDLRTLAPERDQESFRMADVVLRGSVENKLLINLLTTAYIAENGNMEAVYGGFAVDVDTGETTPLSLTNHYSATTVPVQVLDSHGPKLLVFADISETVDKAANALVHRRRMGLIDPQDYLNGRAEYQMIDSLRDF